MSRNKKKSYNHAKIMASKTKNKNKNNKKNENNKKKQGSRKDLFNFNRQFNELTDLNDDNLVFGNNQDEIYNYYYSKKNDKKNRKRGLFIHSNEMESEGDPESDENDRNKPLRHRKVVFVKCQYNLNEEPKELFKEIKETRVSDENSGDVFVVINAEDNDCFGSQQHDSGSEVLIDVSEAEDQLKEEFESEEEDQIEDVFRSERESQLEEKFGSEENIYADKEDHFLEAEDTEDEDEVELYNFEKDDQDYVLEYSIDESFDEDSGTESCSDDSSEDTPITAIIEPTENLTLSETVVPFGEDECDDILTSIDYHIINMQQGAADNRYNIRCFQLFMDTEYHWINTMELSDLLCYNLGFPEHRLKAFYESVYNRLIKQKDEHDQRLFDRFCDNVELSDGEISESLDYLIENVLESGEEEEDEDSDGLQQMLSFAQNMDKQRDLNLDPQDLPKFNMKIKGKGKKRKLILDENKFDEYTRDLLQEKYKLRITTKAAKRNAKTDFISKENENSDNILLKYPYGMHVLSMREEIESFANDNKKWLVGSKRSFPPFDPHGNKVVVKFGKHFNFAHKKLVSKQHTYIQLTKTKNTIKKFQNLAHVDLLCRQRPVFMRKDVKMPRDLALKFNDENQDSNTRASNKLSDGAIVAAGARELTSENLGFKMLAKMGWSSGMSLGAVYNESIGIKEPVVAIIKKGRTGLRHTSSKENNPNL